MGLDSITVSYSAGSYPVAFTSFSDAMQALPKPRVVISDDEVWASWGHAVPESELIVRVSPGEASKSLESYGKIVEKMAQAGLERAVTVVALGGGVVGDLAGFVAATYMRGVPYIQVPTSLLAQVDSSVGGKVAVDTPQGKNLIGAFHQPRAVYVACETLRTLPRRHLVNGMAEVWKYGFILDAAFVDTLAARRARGDIDSIVRRCIELKAAIVKEDEFDRTGRRAVLNFGHTIGHAIEQVTGYSDVLHGEGVAIGMVVESELGERLGITQAGTTATVKDCLASAGLPTTHDALRRVDDMMLAMMRDKKVQGGELAFSLLDRVGECKLVSGVPQSEVRAILLR